MVLEEAVSQLGTMFDRGRTSTVSWHRQAAVERRVKLTEIFAQVSRKALQGDRLEYVLGHIVNGLTAR